MAVHFEGQSSTLQNILDEMQGKVEVRDVLTEQMKEVANKKVELGANQKNYSELFGKSASGREHAITVFQDTDWDEHIRIHIPDPNPAYILPAEATERLALALEQGDKVLMHGPTGAGKSSLVKQICAITRRPFIRINMTGDMESVNFFGQLSAEEGSTKWHDGPMTESVRYGAVCLVDEWELSPPEINMGLQWLLEDDGELLLKEMPASSGEKKIKPHKQHRIICGGNTKGFGDDTGSHAGTTVQNLATIDRFQTVINLQYLESKHEIAIIKGAVPKIDDSVARKMVTCAALIRSSYVAGDTALTMSPRTLINWARKAVYWGDPKKALSIVYLDKLPDENIPTVKNLFVKSFGSNWN